MIKIICIGKIKEQFYKEAINEFLKRLTKYIKVEIIELDEEISANPSISLIKEKDKILSKLNNKQYLIALDINGKEVNSIELAQKINKLLIDYSDIVFIIGSSHGLHDDIKKKVNYCLSFSKLTFPHQLFRVILLEQIYRSFTIINNEPYHK